MDIIGLQAILGDAAFQDGVKRYADGVSKMESATDSGASAMSKIWAVGGAAVAVGAAAVVAGIGAIVAVSKTGLDALTSWNDSVNTLSDNLGTTGEQSSAWAVAFQHVGLSVEEGGAGLNFFVKNLDNLKQVVPGAKGVLTPFQLALKTLGVSAFTATGKLRTFDELTPDILDAFQKMPAGIQKTALAMDLFGSRAGTKFLDFLSGGSEGLEKAREMAKLYGLELDTDLSNAVEDFGFAMNDLNLGVKGFWVILGKSVLPVAIKFITLINDKFIPPLIAFANFIAPKIAAALGGLVTIFEDLFNLFTGAKTRDEISDLAADLGTLAESFGLNGRAVSNFVEGIVEGFRKAIPIVQDVIGVFRDFAVELGEGKISDAVSDFVSGLLQIAGVGEDTANRLGMVFGDIGGVFRDLIVELSEGKIDDAFGDFFAGLSIIWTTEVQPMLAELVGNIGAFLATNGPLAWTALTKWATDFWGWLSGPNGAIAQVSSKVFEIAVSVATWLGAYWNSTIAPALEGAGGWANKFWDWVTGPQGVISQAADQILAISIAMRAASETQASKDELRLSGKNLALSILYGAGAFAESPEGQKESDNVLLKIYGTLNQAAINNKAANEIAGREMARGIFDGIVQYWNENLIDHQMWDWLNKSADALLLNLNELAAKIARGVIEAINKAMLDLHINLPPIGLPGLPPPVTQSPVTQPVTQSAGLTASGGVGSLQVMVAIDGTELKNFSATAAYNATTELFTAATAAVGGAQ